MLLMLIVIDRVELSAMSIALATRLSHFQSVVTSCEHA